MFERVARLSLFLHIGYVHTFDTHTFERKSKCAGASPRPAIFPYTGALVFVVLWRRVVLWWIILWWRVERLDEFRFLNLAGFYIPGATTWDFSRFLTKYIIKCYSMYYKEGGSYGRLI